MEIPLAATFLGLFGWNVYQLIKKFKARERQSCLVKLIEDQSNSLIMTLSPYKKRKITDFKEVVIKNPQIVEIQDNKEQYDCDSYQRIQTVLEQVEYERFQEQDYIDNAQNFNSSVFAQNKDDLRKNKQNKDFSFTSQNQNQNDEDQKINNLEIYDQVNEQHEHCSDLAEKETNNNTLTNVKEQQQINQVDDDFNYNNQIQRFQNNSFDDQILQGVQNSNFQINNINNEQPIFQQGNYTIGQFQVISHNLEVQSNMFQNFYNPNQEESILPFFAQNNTLIPSQQSSNLIQNISQPIYELPKILQETLNQTQQQKIENEQNNQNYFHNFTQNCQPIYSVNNIQQSNQIFNQLFQGISNNQLNKELLHSQNSIQYQPRGSLYIQDIKNKNTIFQNIGFKEQTQLPRFQNEEEQFSFKKRNTKFEELNLEQNQFKNDGQKTSINNIQQSKLNKGQAIFITNSIDNQPKQQKELKSSHFNDFSFYLQLLGGGGGLNTKVSVPSGNLLKLLLNN
ncbi:unnamed protein product [Paramecium sonneborni]|uniref:Uncharacterized protein n=1 Tax=Paramecium sonneborni TaxID=65129 RepID=A0A8S1L322_9CILI|nr:unnamed protein product [Paramecium sonneborni]